MDGPLGFKIEIIIDETIRMTKKCLCSRNSAMHKLRTAEMKLQNEFVTVEEDRFTTLNSFS